MTNATNIIATSGIANYASGQAIANESDILALINASGTATSLISTSGIATYASGNSITNATNVIAVSGIANYASGHVPIANYASGQAVANEADIALVSGIAANRTINFGLNGGTQTPSSGVKRYSCKSPYNGIITGWEIAANSSGNIIFDIWKSSDGLKPEPTDSICNRAFPHCSGQFASNGTLAGWTTAFSQGDIFAIVLNEVQGSGFQQIDLCIKYTDNA